jgi:hypothetical protein
MPVDHWAILLSRAREQNITRKGAPHLDEGARMIEHPGRPRFLFEALQPVGIGGECSG